MPRAWIRDELVVAMNLYGRLPFGQLDARTPLVIEVAAKMNRSPGSLAMKLCNLASFDPQLAARGVVGLKGASRLDREVWDAFNADWEAMGAESEESFNRLMVGSSAPPSLNKPVEDETWLLREGPTEVERSVRLRLGQDFFRRTVLVSYGHRCCITGNPIPALLSASHIVRWADDSKNRWNPRNGLCLAKTHDAAFDRHLITLDADLRVVLSRQIRDLSSAETIRVNFAPYEGKKIDFPHRFMPDEGLLERHRQHFAEVSR